MKIAFIATYDFAIPGGVKNHVCDLASALRNQGNSVYVIAPSSNPAITSKIPNFIQIARFPSAAKTGSIPPHFLINPAVIPRLQKLLKSEAFDLVHIHEPLIPPLCLSTLLHKKTPLFATFHTYNENGQFAYKLFRPLFNSWLKRLAGRIAVSIPAKNYIEAYFPYDYRIIPNGVCLEKFSNTSAVSPQLTPGYFNLLFVGHAQFKRKGLRYMLEAYRILKKEYPQLRLIIAGTKWAGRSQPIELDDTDLADILYLGTVSDAELASLYRSVDVFCAPSIGDESFGMVLTEAMASGAPIVTTNINGYASVVSDDKDALLVPPKDSHALAAAIKRLIDDPALRQRLVEQGQVTVQRYSWNIVANDIMNYYKERLGNHAAH